MRSWFLLGGGKKVVVENESQSLLNEVLVPTFILKWKCFRNISSQSLLNEVLVPTLARLEAEAKVKVAIPSK